MEVRGPVPPDGHGCYLLTFPFSQKPSSGAQKGWRLNSFWEKNHTAFLSDLRPLVLVELWCRQVLSAGEPTNESSGLSGPSSRTQLYGSDVTHSLPKPDRCLLLKGKGSERMSFRIWNSIGTARQIHLRAWDNHGIHKVTLTKRWHDFPKHKVAWVPQSLPEAGIALGSLEVDAAMVALSWKPFQSSSWPRRDPCRGSCRHAASVGCPARQKHMVGQQGHTKRKKSWVLSH